MAEALAKRCRPGVRLLHDRKQHRGRANIDHLAVTPTGVWVIDAKRYAGQKIRVEKPLFDTAKLVIAGRDKTKLVDGLMRQVETVRAVIDEIAPGTPVHGAFCFVDGDVPLLGTREIRGLPILNRRSLAKRLGADGPVTDEAVAALATALADRFPPA